MKNLRVLCIACVVGMAAMSPPTAEAYPRSGGPFGIGVIFHEPTGLTAKVFFTETQAFDFHIGIDAPYDHRYNHLFVAFDYLIHIDLGANNSVVSMPLYIGLGLGLVFDDFNDGRTYCSKFGCYDDRHDVYAQIRVPIGLSLQFADFGGELFLEVIPQLFVVPAIGFDLDSALGFRYYF